MSDAAADTELTEAEEQALRAIEHAAHEHANKLARLFNERGMRPSASHMLGLLILSSRLYALGDPPLDAEGFGELATGVHRRTLEVRPLLIEAAATGRSEPRSKA